MEDVSSLKSPEPLSDKHDFGQFSCGEASLDEWLTRRSRSNQASGASRTYVVCHETRVVAFHALASGVIATENAPGRFKRNMPNPIPVAVLARLAVDRQWRGKGIGRALFRDAALRVSQAADAIGIRGIVVHAISLDAKKFYEALGFEASPQEPMTLRVTLTDVRAALADDQES
jgi:predicted N-acetyltransferase YhbS